MNDFNIFSPTTKRSESKEKFIQKSKEAGQLWNLHKTNPSKSKLPENIKTYQQTIKYVWQKGST